MPTTPALATTLPSADLPMVTPAAHVTVSSKTPILLSAYTNSFQGAVRRFYAVHPMQRPWNQPPVTVRCVRLIDLLSHATPIGTPMTSQMNINVTLQIAMTMKARNPGLCLSTWYPWMSAGWRSAWVPSVNSKSKLQSLVSCISFTSGQEDILDLPIYSMPPMDLAHTTWLSGTSLKLLLQLF